MWKYRVGGSGAFGYVAWSVVIGLAFMLGVAMCASLVGSLDTLYMENGPLENMEMGLWLLSALAAAAAYRRWTSGPDRLVAFWVTAVSCLAALREADAHILLNPMVLGRFGVRYRIDWILDPQASLLLKLGYAALFLLILSSVFVPLFRMRASFWRLGVGGDAAVGMLLVAAAGMFLGYVMDDVLRYSPLMTKSVRQLTEETGEFMGAAAFCAGSLLLWRRPVSERLRRLAGAAPDSTAQPTNAPACGRNGREDVPG